jgi:hypothetical protein
MKHILVLGELKMIDGINIVISAEVIRSILVAFIVYMALCGVSMTLSVYVFVRFYKMLFALIERQISLFKN